MFVDARNPIDMGDVMVVGEIQVLQGSRRRRDCQGHLCNAVPFEVLGFKLSTQRFLCGTGLIHP